MVLMKLAMAASLQGQVMPSLEATYRPVPMFFISEKFKAYVNDRDPGFFDVDMYVGLRVSNFELKIGHEVKLKSLADVQEKTIAQISYEKEF